MRQATDAADNRIKIVCNYANIDVALRIFGKTRWYDLAGQRVTRSLLPADLLLLDSVLNILHEATVDRQEIRQESGQHGLEADPQQYGCENQ